MVSFKKASNEITSTFISGYIHFLIDIPLRVQKRDSHAKSRTVVLNGRVEHFDVTSNIACLLDLNYIAMASTMNQAPPGTAKITSIEEHRSASGVEQEGPTRPILAVLDDNEKQELFLKRLYALSHKAVAETPEERRADHSVRGPHPASSRQAQPVRNTPSAATPSSPKSRASSFVSRLSEMTTACVGLETLCAGRNANIESPPREAIKKNSIALPVSRQVEIPKTITLSESRVSRLDDDDSLARHIAELARCTPAPSEDYYVSHPIGMDDTSRNSPQGVHEMAYDEMYISRISSLNKSEANDHGDALVDLSSEMEI